jgi:hypothetical protein
MPLMALSHGMVDGFVKSASVPPAAGELLTVPSTLATFYEVIMVEAFSLPPDELTSQGP